MDPKKSQKHKGLVLALLSTLTWFTHASLRTPVRMPLLSCLGTKEQVSGTISQPNTPCFATPPRVISSDRLLAISENLT